MIGVIPAAGHGTRAYPYTKGIPKSMLEVAGSPNLTRVIAIMRDQLHIQDIVVIIGEFGQVIRQYFGDGSAVGVRLTYVENDAIDKGLSYSILLSRPYVDDHFCVILGDECYLDSNHAELLTTPYRRWLATCAVQPTEAEESIHQNYAVHVDNGLIRRIVEKPKDTRGALLGMGTFVFSPAFFEHLERALSATDDRPRDPVSVLGRLCAEGAEIAPFYLRGRYVNINNRDQLNRANYLVRSNAFSERTLALVLMYKGSMDATRRTVAEFHHLGRFRQIVLVMPPQLSAPADLPAACVMAPSDQYGAMMHAGLDAADADVLITALSDGSFAPGDVQKFLEYLKDADLVVGTRTTRQLIEQGTNMRGIVRFAHVLLAKLLEFFWWGFEPRLTDVGCTYRALWSSTYRLIRPNLTTSGPEYAVEMLLETLRCRKRVIEIPVTFRLRQPGLKEKDQTVRTFLAALSLIVRRRIAAAA
jgi:dTDP-glucose pyrophosphorylase